MSIKYEINQWGKSKITPVVCIKETPKQVWIERTDYRGRKDVSRRSKAGTFFDTWKEAHDFLLTRARGGLEAAQRQVQSRKESLAEVEALTEPASEIQP